MGDAASPSQSSLYLSTTFLLGYYSIYLQSFLYKLKNFSHDMSSPSSAFFGFPPILKFELLLNGVDKLFYIKQFMPKYIYIGISLLWLYDIK